MECQTKKQCDLLLKSQKLVDRPIKVNTHPTLNSSRGVIRCGDVAGKAETDIRDELSDQGVATVKRVRIKDRVQERDTNTLFLTPVCQRIPSKDICE